MVHSNSAGRNSSARRGLDFSKAAGVITILDPAPAEPFDDDIYSLVD